MMETKQFINLVKDMRDNQKAYFKNKDYPTLKLCKNLEAQVDSELKILTGEVMI